jgi:hypothetical protein
VCSGPVRLCLNQFLRSVVHISSLASGHSGGSPSPDCTDILPRLVTDVFLLLVAASVALDVTAPHKPALAFLLHIAHPCLVASPAAQQATTVRPHTGAITETTPRPQNTHPETDRTLITFTVEDCLKMGSDNGGDHDNEVIQAYMAETSKIPHLLYN